MVFVKRFIPFVVITVIYILAMFLVFKWEDKHEKYESDYRYICTTLYIAFIFIAIIAMLLGD